MKKIIFGVIAIVAVLVVVFLSQKSYFNGTEKTFVYGAIDQARAYSAKGVNWAISTVYPKISGEAQKRGDIIKNEVNLEKEKISEGIGEKISNYFSGVTNSVLHPGTPQNCPAQTSSGSGK